MVIAIDPGHGGRDSGAVYNGRQEKDDNLRLAKLVGDILEKNGVDVVYTRENDIYETPFKKATDANNAGADYFVSFHRNSSEYPNQYSGVEVLVYSDTGVRSKLANNILDGMEEAGFKNIGVDERKDLVVLRRTQMPAVLIESGFINNDEDNRKFDENINVLAQGIADGILNTIRQNARSYSFQGDEKSESYSEYDEINDSNQWQNDMYDAKRTQNMTAPVGMNDNEETDRMTNNNRNCNCNCPDVLYRVQVGAFKNRDLADRLLNSLLIEEFPAYIVFDDGLYKVQVGAYRNLSNAIAMEYKLRQYRYNTYITTK